MSSFFGLAAAGKWPAPRGENLLDGGAPFYDTYETADGRWVSIAPLEPKFFGRLCECIGRPELAERQFDPDQGGLGEELASVFATRTLADWLSFFDDEDVCVGPVATYAEGAAEFGVS